MKTMHAALVCRVLSFSIAMLSGVVPTQAATTTEADTKVVTIGFSGPMSGNSAAMGKSQEHAAELALHEATAQGLRIDGKRIAFKLLSQDDRGDPRIAALAADYLVRVGVVAVVGHWNTAASVSASKIYNAAGIPEIAPGSTGRQYTQAGYPGVFRIVGHDDDGGIYASQYALQTLQARRIAIINDDTAFGVMLADQFVKGLRDKSMTAVSRQTISGKTSDFNSALANAKHKDVDLIFFGGLGSQAAALALNMKRMDVKARLLAADGIVGPHFLQLTGAAGEGTFGLAPGQAQEKMAGWKKFRDKFTAAYGDNIEFFAPFAYDAANMIVAAIRQAGSTEPAQITTALHRMKYTGLTGAISFDEQGNLNNPAYTIYQVQAGKWVPIQAFGKK